MGKERLLNMARQPEQNMSICEIPEEIFLKVWGIFYGGKRGWRLEVDRKDNNSSYSKNNCVLACCLCNCGKSDKIGFNDFEQVGEIIEKIWKKTARLKKIKFQ
ncbi:MAG: hypothetical protein HY887_05625 [Deltaproteobacteria bacterium]|nr:hypothetical protein [Deltaproteobacteria bacterium]